ncbi:PHP domain protein [Limihaloglobus sulfuriphilus]|uniref:PHP domain protein n=1 Tax=Limihaloglobus sulfuriphilus TaxID=1851148 RepID=A0A1Q2MCD5_9BACT|nr:hypothetical protein [Limihaloglobus sulfuriphilus]AQQ70361.1 PHP domain protein [Limihaloglobus sulfuriphilus]
MNRRDFLKITAAISTFPGQIAIAESLTGSAGASVKLLNPYADVDWGSWGSYKAALHLHTLQSDGWNSVREVTGAYKKAGYSIMSITDHDFFKPNLHVRPGELPPEKASPYPENPKPENYPANTTWPWTDYGGHSPERLDMVGIQGNELSYRHHINSYFNDYGVWYEKTNYDVPYEGVVDENGKEIWEDDQLLALAAAKNSMKGNVEGLGAIFSARLKAGSLAILNHPGVEDSYRWWQRQSLDWYVERFEKHSFDYLIGMEVTNNNTPRRAYDEALWDQLLARFMPARPIWGFGNDDMHKLFSTKQTFNVFYLDKCTSENVHAAMQKGHFCFCRSTRSIDYTVNDCQLDTFPQIQSIAVDQDAGTIKINAVDYDEIKWISSPLSLEPIDDYKTSSQPWEVGNVVHTGSTLDYRNTPGIKNYVRAELLRNDGSHTQRTFTNPFGIVKI